MPIIVQEAQIGSGDLYNEHRPSGAYPLDSFLIVAVELPKRASSPALAGATPEIREAGEACE